MTALTAGDASTIEAAPVDWSLDGHDDVLASFADGSEVYGWRGRGGMASIRRRRWASSMAGRGTSSSWRSPPAAAGAGAVSRPARRRRSPRPTGDRVGAAIVPDGGCDVGLGFAPSSRGALDATLRVTSNAPSSPNVVALSGHGLQGRAQAPDELSHGPVQVGFWPARSTRSCGCRTTGRAASGRSL